jgi:dipeptidyl-peptidase-4
MRNLFAYAILLIISTLQTSAQDASNKAILTLERIFNTSEFYPERPSSLTWIEKGASFVTLEENNFVKHDSKTGKRSDLLRSGALKKTGHAIEDYSISDDGTAILMFTNSSRVWRSNTKGDYWYYDIPQGSLLRLGKSLPSSSLMFAKLSGDKKTAFYVSGFNIYSEDISSGKITKLTTDGDGKIINGTFDWAYEEEFGKRDGFALSPDGSKIAFWQIDASDIKNFYLINNTDSLYSRPYAVQYPKAGQQPAGAKIGVIDIATRLITWVNPEGNQKDFYIPGMQWVNDDVLLIERLNRKQNELNVMTYRLSDRLLKTIYTEKEDTWVDMKYPDITVDQWAQTNALLADNNTSFLRMTEGDGWRHVYKINIMTGQKTLLTPGNFDVASICSVTDKNLYFIASPENATQRFLFMTDLKGTGKSIRVTPAGLGGINTYDISPDGKFAIHQHEACLEPLKASLIRMSDHTTIDVLTSNEELKKNFAALALPDIKFRKVTTSDGVEMDVRMIYPLGFDPSKKYPVLFYVYGEPWDQVAVDALINPWNLLMAQKGYFVIAMDNRGSCSLKGSEWRKSLYRKVGVLNSRDQAMAARELLKEKYFDPAKVAVWGWSGG